MDNRDITNKYVEVKCYCEANGYCPVFNIYMSKANQKKCASSSDWRRNFETFFGKPPTCEKELAIREEKARQHEENRKKQATLDQAMSEVAQTNITENDLDQGKDGAGDALQKVLAKFGITSDNVEEWVGTSSGCGCNKRRSFLNKIFSFKKRE